VRLGYAASADSLEGVEARVVPAAHSLGFDQTPYVLLAHDGALEVQAAVLALHGLGINEKSAVV
jgi:hypothetical protein